MFQVYDIYGNISSKSFLANQLPAGKLDENLFVKRVDVNISTEHCDDTTPVSIRFYNSLLKTPHFDLFKSLLQDVKVFEPKCNWARNVDLAFGILLLQYGRYISIIDNEPLLMLAILKLEYNSENIASSQKLKKIMLKLSVDLPKEKTELIMKSMLIFNPNLANVKESEEVTNISLTTNTLDVVENLLSANPVENNAIRLITDDRRWVRSAKDAMLAFKTTNGDNAFKNRKWLMEKLAIFPILDVLDTSYEIFCDKLIIRLYVVQDKEKIFNFLITLFGYAYQDEIQEILNASSEITACNISSYAPLFYKQIPKHVDTCKPNKEFQEFSMLYVKPEQQRHDEVGAESTPESNITFEWVLAHLKNLPRFKNDPFKTATETAHILYDLLKSPRSNSEVVETFTDIFGLDFVDVVFDLVVNRKDDDKIFSTEKPSTGAIKKIPKKHAPTISSQVVVQSEKEKRLRKEMRKEEKRHLRNYKNDLEADNDLIETGFLPLPHLERYTAVRDEYEAACVEPILPTQSVSYKQSLFQRTAIVDPTEGCLHIYESAKKKQFGTLLLAEGTDIKNFQLYKQIDIPVVKSKPTELLPNNQRIKITSLDPLGQKVFSNIEQLNVIQSIVFKTAYESSQNLLICAPTGAGKTNIALLAITKCLKPYVIGTKLIDKNFKIVYVAPMKALAAEMTRKFSEQLRPIGVHVKELTGDMQLSPSEIKDTQILVTTPEKWDVVTRKPDGDTALPRLVRLLIIDEVHLLNEDRGHVIEAIVARTLRLVEKTQMCCRIVGLSATLPNYLDVAQFLRVNIRTGLFYFDQRFRPVPLETTFIGCQENNLQQVLDLACYDQCINALRNGHQVMVFVHTRRGTVNTALALRTKAQTSGTIKLLQYDQNNGGYVRAKQTINKSGYHELRDLFQSGLAVHHAGMLRTDRNHVEKYFLEGYIRVLVCTATLAWGVNLPAHTVIIKGTTVYSDGQNTDLDILDVQQIFGRAGRPQFDTSGHAIIITEMNRLDKYLRLMTNQIPIESKFIKHLADNLNAEIVLGTVTSVDEAVMWLNYTYLLIRMKMNPLAYGVAYHEKLEDPVFHQRCYAMIHDCALKLDAARMIRYNISTGDLISTDYGRIASHFYIKYDTIMKFNTMMAPIMSEGDILQMVTTAEEFQQIRVRDEETEELLELLDGSSLVVGSLDSVSDKVNLLLQGYLSRTRLHTSSLIADMHYAVQNIPRLARALFEIFLRLNNAIMAGRLLKFSLMFDNQQWDYESPLRQFQQLSYEVLNKIERHDLKIHRIRELDVTSIGNIIRNQREAKTVLHLAECFPYVDIETEIMPITRHVLRIVIDIKPDFVWDVRIHRYSQSFWLWIEDPEHNIIYHHEYFTLTKKLVSKGEPIKLFITIPLVDPIPPQYYVRVYSDKWLRAESSTTFKFTPSMLPSNLTIQTDLENLQPLSTRALKNSKYQSLYPFNFFNPIQTQMFFVLYQTDENVLLGAPTGSGKTIVAELAILRLFNTQPNRKAVYVAPLKALVRERVEDWTKKFGHMLNKVVVEMTGDSMPDKKTLDRAQIIITTPEKWDIITRNWETRAYVQSVGLLIMDEVHLLGEDRGPVLEAIVSRTNYIASKHHRTIRMIGLSTGIANSYDLASWLGVREHGLFNFRPSVRPVPLEVHISGYSGKHYCPRMALMNKPTFQAIREHAPDSPSIVFVSSRRQTRITAMELINFLNMDSNDYHPPWLQVSQDEIEYITNHEVKDETLQHTLIYGVGVHHAGLLESDRSIVEDLFLKQKIRVLVATATLAWGVNFPAHLVVIKGTEYYDGKHRRYIDMPITDVLQMMGRAGRPQFDQNGVAVVLVQDIKKSFYKKFLYEPFPVESHMLEVLPNHIYAEIATGLITSKMVAKEYITWTYLYRRLINNPTYYNLVSTTDEAVLGYINGLVDSTIDILVQHHCCTVDEEGYMLQTTRGARVGSNYYLDYRTVKFMTETLTPDLSFVNILKAMCDTYEFSEVPVRHNEELMNATLARLCRIKVTEEFESPHVKTFLLMLSHFSRLPVPCADYSIDLKLILEQCGRVLQAFLEYASVNGWLTLCVQVIHVCQMLVQATWIDCSPYSQIPGVLETQYTTLKTMHTGKPIDFCDFVMLTKNNIKDAERKLLHHGFIRSSIQDIINYVDNLPLFTVRCVLKDAFSNEIWSDHPKRESTIRLSLKNNRAYTFEVYLSHYKRYRSKVYAPFYPKTKQESWMILFGTEEEGLLPVVVKRCIFTGKYSKQFVKFTTPNFPGSITYRFMIVSDSYIGLDQEYTVSATIEMCDESDDEETTVQSSSLQLMEQETEG